MRRANPNGDFDVWNYGHTIPDVTHNAITATGWRSQNTSTARLACERSLDVPTYAQAGRVITQSHKLTVTQTAAVQPSRINGIVHFGEGIFWRPLHGKPTHLRFWLKTSKAGPYYCGIRTGMPPHKTLPMRYVQTAADVWQEHLIPMPANPLDGGWGFGEAQGFALFFFMGFGSQFHATPDTWQDGALGGGADQTWLMDELGGYFQLAGVQLEANGPTAFAYDPLWDQQACARYVQTSFREGVRPDNNQGIVSGNEAWPAVLQPNGWIVSPDRVIFPEGPMRTEDFDLTIYNPMDGPMGSIRNWAAGTNTDPEQLWIDNRSKTGARVSAPAPANTQGGDTMGFHWVADASVPPG